MSWIKMRSNLDSDPDVITIAAAVGLDELDVIGRLWKLWSWADQHSITGNAVSVTDVTLDRFVRTDGFAKAMRSVKWLEGESGCISFPRFDRHNGQTAKQRALTKERVAAHRNANSVTSVTHQPLLEKRRGDKIRVQRRDSSPVPSVPTKSSANDSGESSRAWPLTKGVKFPNGLTDSEWLVSLAQDKAYEGIDVHREHGKMANWCRENSKIPTRRRFINWLNRCDRPIKIDKPKPKWKDMTNQT